MLDQCEVTPEARDGIKEIYMNSLAKKLLRCWEIVERYRAEFNKQIASYKRPEAHSQIIAAPYVMRLEEECHNFLYEAKSFIRDCHLTKKIAFRITTNHSIDYPAHDSSKLWFPFG
jgi:site-specific DNA-adenine methylase